MPHRKVEPTEEGADTTYVYSRSEDRSFWAWTAAVLEKYKLLLWGIFFLVGAAGFGFRTPQQVFGEIHAEIDTLKMHERAAEVERRALDNKIDILLKLRCYELEQNKQEGQAMLAGLNCGKILRGE